MSKIIKIVLILVAVIIVFDGFYILNETEQAIITQFGSPVGNPVVDAGLKFKVPFIQKITRFDKRILDWDGDPKETPTSDKKFIYVDTFARWKIINPLLFYQTTGNEMGAHSKLDPIIDGATRDVISLNKLIEVVRFSNREMKISEDMMESQSEEEINSSVSSAKISSGREAIQNEIYEKAKKSVSQFGIELVDVKIKRVNYVEDVRRKVYDRMNSERQKIAAKYRSEGQGKAAEIMGQMNRELDKIRSEAYKESQEIIGKADAEATKIYASAYNRDPSFYEFMKTMEAYKNVVSKKNTMFFSTDNDFFKYLKSIK